MKKPILFCRIRRNPFLNEFERIHSVWVDHTLIQSIPAVDNTLREENMLSQLLARLSNRSEQVTQEA